MADALKIQPIELCGAVGKCQASPSGYASLMQSRYSAPSAERVAAHALQQLAIARQMDIDTHERNVPLLVINRAVRERVEALMTEIGMPKRWSMVDTKSRSRYPKRITTDAGYLTDLLREVRVDDSFVAATATHERLLKAYTEYAERAVREAELARGAAEREQAAALERRKADMELAALLLRYELPIESTWRDVLDTLRKRDQRLNLAVAMSQTRADWSEGAYRVHDAMRSFVIETTEDKDIATSVLAGLEDFDDGRVFRDCEWNYDRLFASVVDRQLTADVQAALQRTAD